MKHFILSLLFGLSLSTWAQAVPLPGPGFISSDSPIIVIDTHQHEILDDPKIEAATGIIDNGPGRRNATDSFNNYTGKIGTSMATASARIFIRTAPAKTAS